MAERPPVGSVPGWLAQGHMNFVDGENPSQPHVHAGQAMTDSQILAPLS